MIDKDDERQSQAEPIPFIAHEADMARQERTIKRLWIALIICILIISGMFVYEIQFETVVVTQKVEQDAEDGENHFVGGDYIGTTESDYYN